MYVTSECQIISKCFSILNNDIWWVLSLTVCAITVSFVLYSTLLPKSVEYCENTSTLFAVALRVHNVLVLPFKNRWELCWILDRKQAGMRRKDLQESIVFTLLGTMSIVKHHSPALCWLFPSKAISYRLHFLHPPTEVNDGSYSFSCVISSNVAN